MKHKIIISLVSLNHFHSFILNTYLKPAQTPLDWSLPLVSRTCCFWFLVSLPPSMTFHPHPKVMQTFLELSDTNFFYHHSTYSNSLKASRFLAKGLLLHYKQLLADLCGLWWPQNILPPACIFWQCSISDTIELSQFFLKLFNLLFLFLNNPNILGINPDILQRWCNVPVCTHSWCWCWWRCWCLCWNHFVFHDVLPPLLMNNAKSMW